MKNQPDPEAIVSGILAGLALAGFNLQARRRKLLGIVGGKSSENCGMSI
jgi:hypothetical protein